MWITRPLPASWCLPVGYVYKGCRERCGVEMSLDFMEAGQEVLEMDAPAWRPGYNLDNGVNKKEKRHGLWG